MGQRKPAASLSAPGGSQTAQNAVFTDFSRQKGSQRYYCRWPLVLLFIRIIIKDLRWCVSRSQFLDNLKAIMMEVVCKEL